MKLLVFSDSHGRADFLERMLKKEPMCETVFFLGDGLSEVEKYEPFYPERKFIKVKGNNDFYNSCNTEAYKHIDGVTIMSCHGHLLGVRETLTPLFKKAEGVRAHLALYGHTHIPNMNNSAAFGVCAVNPGALCEGKYCVIEIKNGSFDIEFKSVF